MTTFSVGSGPDYPTISTFDTFRVTVQDPTMDTVLLCADVPNEVQAEILGGVLAKQWPDKRVLMWVPEWSGLHQRRTAKYLFTLGGHERL